MSRGEKRGKNFNNKFRDCVATGHLYRHLDTRRVFCSVLVLALCSSCPFRTQVAPSRYRKIDHLINQCKYRPHSTVTSTSYPMSNPRISLALLVCGSLTGKVYAEHGNYSAVYARFFQSSLPNGSDAHFILDPYDVQKLQYPSDDQVGTYDAIVLTGSGTHHPRV